MNELNEIKILVSNLTLEQFSELVGMLVAFSCLIIITVNFICMLFKKSDVYCYKTAMYYKSLRMLNRRFKKLKNCDIGFMMCEYLELMAIIELLRYQGILPLFLYKRLSNKCSDVYDERNKEELCY